MIHSNKPFTLERKNLMDISVSTGFGIRISHDDVIKRGFLSLDNLADEIVDNLPFMTRLSNGSANKPEDALVMAISDSVLRSHTSGVHEETPQVSQAQKDELMLFISRTLPGVWAGQVLAAVVFS